MRVVGSGEDDRRHSPLGPHRARCRGERGLVRRRVGFPPSRRVQRTRQLRGRSSCVTTASAPPRLTQHQRGSRKRSTKRASASTTSPSQSGLRRPRRGRIAGCRRHVFAGRAGQPRSRRGGAGVPRSRQHPARAVLRPNAEQPIEFFVDLESQVWTRCRRRRGADEALLTSDFAGVYPTGSPIGPSTSASSRPARPCRACDQRCPADPSFRISGVALLPPTTAASPVRARRCTSARCGSNATGLAQRLQPGHAR